MAFDAAVLRGGYVGELGRTFAVGCDIDRELSRLQHELWDRLLAACRAGRAMSELLEAYDAAGLSPPPMPVAQGLGLGFDLPLVTHDLPLSAAEEHFEVGMVFTLTAFVWKEGVGALYGQEPVHLSATGPELLSAIPFAT